VTFYTNCYKNNVQKFSKRQKLTKVNKTYDTVLHLVQVRVRRYRGSDRGETSSVFAQPGPDDRRHGVVGGGGGRVVTGQQLATGAQPSWVGALAEPSPAVVRVAGLAQPRRLERSRAGQHTPSVRLRGGEFFRHYLPVDRTSNQGQGRSEGQGQSPYLIKIESKSRSALSSRPRSRSRSKARSRSKCFGIIFQYK